MAARLALMYHRVTEPGRNPFGIIVHPDRFSDHMKCIRRHAEIVPLARLTEFSDGPKVAVTLDDGYVDNVTQARPILEFHEANATMFIVPGKIGSTTEFWWDKLERLILGSTEQRDPIEVRVDPRITIRLRFDDAVAREQTLWTLHSALLPLPPARIDTFLASLAAELCIPDEETPAHRALTLPELADLSMSGLVEIGAHSMSHPALPALPFEEQRAEIEGSRSALEDMLHIEVRSFAYPFGEHDNTTAMLVQEAGLRRACTVEPGMLKPTTDPFRIPRYEVRDWSKKDFEDTLIRWMQQ